MATRQKRTHVRRQQCFRARPHKPVHIHCQTEDVIAGRQSGPLLTEGFAHEPFGQIAMHRQLAQLLRHHQAKPGETGNRNRCFVALAIAAMHEEITTPEHAALGKDRAELRRLRQACGAGKTQRGRRLPSQGQMPRR